MGENKESSSSFPMGETAQERGFSHVPECYEVEPSQRAGSDSKVTDVPLINLDGLCNPNRRSSIIEEIANACRINGFFQVINHGISEPILDGALGAASGFFDLPTRDKAKYMSNDVHNPMRYGTSVRDGEDKVQFWRVFLKHYAHPLKDWIGLWPDNPSDYREKMGEYIVEVQKLAITIMEAITESLGLGPTYLTGKLNDGMQVMAVNGYPPCPRPHLTLGLPPHSDYSCLTIVLQDSYGLEILDSKDKSWRAVPVIHSALQVHVGDQLEVLSNGIYKSVVHKVAVNKEKMRISIASLHSLEMDTKMEAAKELVDEDHPNGYRDSSFRDFLNFISTNDIVRMYTNKESSSSFPMGETSQEKVFSNVPECYKVEPSQRAAGLDSKVADVPLINLDGFMCNPTQKSSIIQEIDNACRTNAFFQVRRLLDQVINHGISQPILDGALSAASGFFDLPTGDKAKFMSNDVHKPVRYGTSVRDGEDNVQFWRVFLKHYAHPLKDWIGLWPDAPSDYKEKMGEYVVEVQKLAIRIMEAITESLGLGPTYLTGKLNSGMQVTAVNGYPSCPQPHLTLGLPPHTDYSCLSIVLQDSYGLQILDSKDKLWRAVPVIHSALQVLVDDQLEVLSNGMYKSVVHKVAINKEKMRISIASLYSLEMDTKMEAAKELVDEDHVNGYRDSNFRDFLNFISTNDIGEGRSFLNALKINQQ
ncbi:hypothetical protein BUALT_Bualt06G0136300 [Buddleja alternifolia]|uniref:Fe2OG dioxygenase domain-containing protein n=1 Tax=Buddleja alternifolia TaxID=168488 RepID=A0AAV6XQU8_9LAMI|nr:hypothetical protein BUALT_Bualt06G0136300 [Buddleja alternifolia]